MSAACIGVACCEDTNFPSTFTSMPIPTILGNGVSGYSFTLVVPSPTWMYGVLSWSESGTLPAGVTWDGASGSFTGTPTETGDFPVTVTITDENGLVSYADIVISVTEPVSLVRSDDETGHIITSDTGGHILITP